MLIDKLLSFVKKNYLYFPQQEQDYLFDLDINKFFLSAFSRINSQKDNKKLVKIGIKLYEFKEFYKKNPCEFDYTKCDDEKKIVNWYKFLISLKDIDKIEQFFNFWKDKHGETKLFLKYYNKFLSVKLKVEREFKLFEEKQKYILSIQELERLIDNGDIHKSKMFLKKLISEYPNKLKLYDYFEKISKLSIQKLYDSIALKSFDDGIDLSLLGEENDTSVEKYEGKSEKELLKVLNKLLKEKKTDEGIKLANRIIKNKKVKNIKKIEKIKNKLVKLEIEKIEKNQKIDYENDLKVLNKLLEDKRIDRLLGTLQGVFSKYDFVNKKNLKKYIPKIAKLESSIGNNFQGLTNVDKFFMKFSKLSEKDLYFFYDKMAWFMKAQIDIKLALNILKVQSKSLSLKKLVYSLLDGINNGKTIADVIENFKEIPLRDISMLKIAEQVGGFEITFENLKNIYEDSIYRKRKIKSIMIYPIITMIVAFLIIIAMLIGVFPKYVSIYEQFDVELPLPTKIMLFLSNFLQHNFLLFLGIIIALFIFVYLFLKTHLGYVIKSWLLLKIPIIKQIHKKAETLYFLENFNIMLKGGLSIVQILDFLINGTGNYFFRKELVLTKMLVLTGDPFSKAMGITEDIVSFNSVILPIEVIYGISIGESTGKLQEIMENLLKNYKKEFNIYLNNFQQVLEPFLILIIGGMIFILVMAIFLPMMGIYQQISKQVRF